MKANHRTFAARPSDAPDQDSAAFARRWARLTAWHTRMRNHVQFNGADLWTCPIEVLQAPRVPVSTGPLNGAGPCVTIGSTDAIALGAES